MKTDAARQRTQIAEQRRKVDFDTYDVTVDELIRRVAKSRIDVAPVYQRQFRWDAARQSCLVESLLLGIPVPPLFMATNLNPGRETQWEVVDGLQRLLTMVNFAGDMPVRERVGLLGDSLRLADLKKLDSLNQQSFAALPADIQSAFEDRPMKVIVLNDKSDLAVRYDLFERLNTGGVVLTPQEVRECVYRGLFMDILSELSDREVFKTVVVLPQSSWRDGTPQEYVLRFFAFLERYQKFEHSVKDFLNDFTKDATSEPKVAEYKVAFDKTFAFLAASFPQGVKTRKGMTPVNLFEAISVGAALALREKSTLRPRLNPDWVFSDELRAFTTGATNSKSRVTGRIEYCRDKFLSRNV